MKTRYFLVTYFKKKNGKFDEFAEFTDQISKDKHKSCNIILDFNKRIVIKGELNGTVINDYNTLYDFYKEAYPQEFA